MCNHPEKIAFRTLRAAADAALENLDRGYVNRPYECECNSFHLTTKGLNGADLTADQVIALAQALGLAA